MNSLTYLINYSAEPNELQYFSDREASWYCPSAVTSRQNLRSFCLQEPRVVISSVPLQPRAGPSPKTQIRPRRQAPPPLPK